MNEFEFSSFLIGFGSAIIALLGLMITIINNYVSSEKFLKKISERVNPILIFDNNLRYFYDSGVSDQIKNIKFENYTEEFNKDFKLVIEFKNHVRFEPLLQAVNNVMLSITSERGPMNSWIFNFEKHAMDKEGLILKLQLLK